MVAGLEDGVEEELGNRINLGRQPRLECNVDGIGVQDEVRNFDTRGPGRISEFMALKRLKMQYWHIPSSLMNCWPFIWMPPKITLIIISGNCRGYLKSTLKGNIPWKRLFLFWSHWG